MSLDVWLVIDVDTGGKEVLEITLFEANITHNLTEMADKAGIYKACWRPEEIAARHAGDIIPILENGLANMKARKTYFEKFNAPNGWGTYKQFVPWVEKYLEACKRNPKATICVSR